MISSGSPGKEVTYFLWLSSFWVHQYKHYVTQWHTVDETNGVQDLVTKEF